MMLSLLLSFVWFIIKLIPAVIFMIAGVGIIYASAMEEVKGNDVYSARIFFIGLGFLIFAAFCSHVIYL